MKTIDEILQEKIEETLSKIDDSYSVGYLSGFYRGLVLAWTKSYKMGWYPGNKWAIDNLKFLHEFMEKRYYAMYDLLHPDVLELIRPYMKGIVKGLEYARKIAEGGGDEE